MKKLIRSLAIIITLLLIWLIIECYFPIGSLAEEQVATYPMYINTRRLNGREYPSIKSSVEAWFEKGETVEAIELNNTGWVLVEGGETGVVWCKAEYLSESMDIRKWKNTSGGSVNLRKYPSYEAKRVGRIKTGRIMHITAEVFGWGYVKDQGWVDLSYFEVVENGE